MKKKIFLIILLFLLVSIFSLSNISTFCKIYPVLGADNESLLLWKYSGATGVQPYRDIFYPYGLLTYYRDLNIFLALFYYFLTSVLFIAAFFGLKRLFQDKFLTTIATISLFIFVASITGFETFSRYGPLAVAAIFFSYIYYENKSTAKILLISGALTGLLFPLMNDFGIYTPIIFIGIAFFDTIIRFHFNLRFHTITQFFRHIGTFFLGYFVGLVPFVIYLFMTQSFFGFLLYLQNLRDIAQFAKTPFFHSIGSIDNIFSISILIATIFSLSVKFFLAKNKSTFNTYLQVGLVIVLLLLEQKSIIRSIDTQISFVGLLLFFCLFYEIAQHITAYKITKSVIGFYFVNISIVILFFIGLHPVDPMVNAFVTQKEVWFALNTFNNKSCVAQNIRYLTQNNKQILQVKDSVTAMEGFNGKVFTFPGEPIFYVLFNQKPPYYPTIYEATPLYAQKQLINYIEDQQITIVLYNTKIKSIHDEVPDTVRGRLLYQYIKTHFVAYKRVGDYLIYKRVTSL